MANTKHLAAFRRGGTEWNRWRHQHPKSKPNLAGANLQNAAISASDLSAVNFSGARLSGLTLMFSDCFSTDFSGADLSHSSVIATNFLGASFRGASLRRAELSHVTFGSKGLRVVGSGYFSSSLSTDLLEADFSDASLLECTFAGVDLRGAIGLDSVKHGGPSIIDIATLYKSRGLIPESFLRGCGVPESLVTFHQSLVGKPIEYYSCFISYSTKDQDFADRLYADLQSHGVRCWFAPHDLRSGRKIHEQIDEAVRVYDRLLLILSEHSMNSEWVKTEIAHARQKERREGHQVLFPIRLAESFDSLRGWKCFDADIGKDSAREIREFFVPDFSNWKDYDSYRQALSGLVMDLKS